MKKRTALLLALTLNLPTLASATTQTVVLTVPTMDCATCPLTIKAALLKLPGVASAKVSYLKREAVVEYDDAKTDLGAIKKATADAGYPSMLKD